jgi:hypothetical protein
MSNLILHMCSSCHNLYQWGEETTLFLYLRQPLINHLVTICPTCQTVQTFWELDDKIIDRLVTDADRPGAVTLKVGIFAADRTWQKFSAATGRPYPSRYKFSYHRNQEQEVENSVKFFRHLLDTGKMP